MTTWVSNSARYFGVSSGVNCSPIIVIRRVCTSGQMLGASRYGSIPGKGECIITPVERLIWTSTQPAAGASYGRSPSSRSQHAMAPVCSVCL